MVVYNHLSETLSIEIKACNESVAGFREHVQIAKHSVSALTIAHQCFDARAVSLKFGRVVGVQSKLRIPPKATWEIK